MLFSTVLSIQQAKTQSLSGLHISLNFEKDTHQLLEPWIFTVEIKNNGNTDIELRSNSIVGGIVSDVAQIKLEIKNRHHEIWTETKSIVNRCQTMKYQPFDLKPSQYVTYYFRCSPAFDLLDIGPNELRITYAPYCNPAENIYAYSAPANLEILNYSEVDLAAYQYLLKLNKPDFILYPIVRAVYDTSDIRYAKYIVDNFPNSILSEYGKLYLCYQYYGKAYLSIRGKDKMSTLEYLRNSKRFGLLALESKNPLILEKANFALGDLLNIVFIAYDFDVPYELEQEFLYAPKH
jgi:hypothetical protein